jgi:hypothetical protein
LERTTLSFLARASAAIALANAPACSQHDDASGPSDAGPGETSCPFDLPANCPVPPPSWSSQVQPLINQNCNPCHGEGGVEQRLFDFTTYGNVVNNRGSILTQVFACKMPPPDAAAPSQQERDALLGWLVCNAPNN